MTLRFAQCPVSWGVEQARAAGNPPWESFLDCVAEAGYTGVELGPLGYLPMEEQTLRTALDARGLELCAGYVMGPLSDPRRRAELLEVCRRTCEVLASTGARLLVLIDAIDVERSATAGNPRISRRLDDNGFEQLVEGAERAARIAVHDFDLTVAFHPHAGTFVEYRDEVDRLMEACDPALVQLCIDSGHSTYAGLDPRDLLKTYAGRVAYLHLKDVDGDVRDQARRDGIGFEWAVSRGIFCPLGTGAVDVGGLLDDLAAQQYSGWLAVEQDRSTPIKPATQRATEDAVQSRSYLEKLVLAPGAATTVRSRRL